MQRGEGQAPPSRTPWPSGCGSRVPQGGTEDLDEGKLSGALRQQLAGRRKDAVTGGEKAADRRTPG
jgi:hypothetical protein